MGGSTAISALISIAIAVAIIIVIQQLDANLLQPRVIGHSVGVKPFYVLVAITIGGALLGFWGVLLSVPMAAFIRMCIIDIRIAQREKALLQKEENKE